MGRAPCCDKANVKRGPWSPEEDAKLKSHMETHGTGGNWISLPQKIGLRRCGKSCRLRWLNYLRPNIKHGGFTEEEDNLICSLYVTIGSRWSIIAAQLPGRTDNDIKNYWNTRLKKKLLGKQRREHQARRDISFTNKQLETTKKGLICYENYPNNEFFGLYPQQPPSLAGYTSGQETQVLNSRDDILIMPSFATIGYDENYDHKQQKDENLERFDQNEEMYKNPSFSSLEGGFDEIQMHGIPPQVGSFSGLELVNSSTVSQEMSTIWEDVNSLLYPSAGLPVHEFCQTRMPQEWTYFEEPRLPGY